MIYFVRHGQTEWNKLEKIQGHKDIELSMAIFMKIIN